MPNKIRELRLEIGWTISDLAEKVGVSRQTIHSIEEGNFARLNVAFQLARTFDLRIEDLFSPDEEAAKKAAPRKRREQSPSEVSVVPPPPAQ